MDLGCRSRLGRRRRRAARCAASRALPPIELLSAWSERVVGAALVGIGLWALSRCLRVGPAPHGHGQRRTIIFTCRLAPRGFAVWDTRTPRSAWACSTASRAARTSLACYPRSRCRHDRRGPLHRRVRRGTVAAMTIFAAAVGTMRPRHPRTTRVPRDDDGRCAAGDCRGRCLADCINL